MLPRPLWMQRQSLPLRLHIRANQPGFAAQLQQPLDLHVQKGNALHHAVAFPDRGQGDVFVAGYLIVHFYFLFLRLDRAVRQPGNNEALLENGEQQNHGNLR